MKEPTPPVPDPSDQADREWIAEVKRAYPDAATMPPGIKELILKKEASLNKGVAMEMDRAMNSFEMLQEQLKALHFSKRKHRTAWLNHLATVLEEWQDHVKKYTEQQEEFARQISNTTTQMEMIRSNYGELSTKAAQNLPKAEIMDDPAIDTAGEQAEKSARSKVVSLLHTCSAVAGGPATQVDSDSEEKEDEEKPRVKRTRDNDKGKESGGIFETGSWQLAAVWHVLGMITASLSYIPDLFISRRMWPSSQEQGTDHSKMLYIPPSLNLISYDQLNSMKIAVSNLMHSNERKLSQWSSL